MADPVIGTESFIRITQDTESIQTEVRDITRPNVDGVAQQRLGTRGKQFSLSAIRDFADEAAFRATLEALEAMIGTIVSWTNNEGTAFPGLSIVGVRIQRKRRCLSSVGGLLGSGATLIGTFRVRCIDTSIP